MGGAGLPIVIFSPPNFSQPMEDPTATPYTPDPESDSDTDANPDPGADTDTDHVPVTDIDIIRNDIDL
jgi:hypothetical protein